jgi:hypothetical protein
VRLKRSREETWKIRVSIDIRNSGILNSAKVHIHIYMPLLFGARLQVIFAHERGGVSAAERSTEIIPGNHESAKGDEYVTA